MNLLFYPAAYLLCEPSPFHVQKTLKGNPSLSRDLSFFSTKPGMKPFDSPHKFHTIHQIDQQQVCIFFYYIWPRLYVICGENYAWESSSDVVIWKNNFLYIYVLTGYRVSTISWLMSPNYDFLGCLDSNPDCCCSKIYASCLLLYFWNSAFAIFFTK